MTTREMWSLVVLFQSDQEQLARANRASDNTF